MGEELRIPVWRTNPPTEPGLYWFKLKTSDEYPPPGVMRWCRVVRHRNGHLTLGTKNYDDGGDYLKVDGVQRWWAGPLPEPME